MTTARCGAYLEAARSAQNLVADSRVATSWDTPSALDGFTVGGLAAHLAAQIHAVAAAMDEGQGKYPTIPILEHYARARWVGAGPDAEINVMIREQGEDAAGIGHVGLLERVDTAVADLTARLADVPEERTVKPPAGPWTLTFDDFLLTRMMEISVHCDDLAVSIGAEPPALPDAVIQPVLALLSTLAARRHGQSKVLRALTRAERAQGSINAF
jgi:uncharacterized protein (TIGR03083 family)